MKHRQEKTPTPFELCCGLYQSQINPVRRDNTKEVQEAQLCKKVWSGIPPALRTQSTRTTGSRGTAAKRAQQLCWRCACTTENWHKPDCIEDPPETGTRAGLNTECKNLLHLVLRDHKSHNGPILVC